MKRFAAAAVASLLALGACGRTESNDGAPTPEENRQLENAADMLDASPDNLVPAGNAVLGNGEDAADDGSAEDPASNSAANAAQ